MSISYAFCALLVFWAGFLCAIDNNDFGQLLAGLAGIATIVVVFVLIAKGLGF